MEKDYPKNTEEEFSGVSGQVDAAVELNGECLHRKHSLGNHNRKSGLCFNLIENGFQWESLVLILVLSNFINLNSLVTY